MRNHPTGALPSDLFNDHMSTDVLELNGSLPSTADPAPYNGKITVQPFGEMDAPRPGQTLPPVPTTLRLAHRAKWLRGHEVWRELPSLIEQFYWADQRRPSTLGHSDN
jgi:hypothetical protein